MTAKEYLKSIRSLEIKLNQKKKELEQMRIMASGLGSASTDAVRVCSSPRADALENRVIRMVELSNKIDQDIEKLSWLRYEIVNQIQGLTNDTYVQILYKRYVDNMKLIDVANEMQYEYQTIRILHGKALKSFQDTYMTKVSTQINI